MLEEVVDVDGNMYDTIKIGNQIWMAENLKVTRYRDGTPISNVKSDWSWEIRGTGAYCIYNKNASNEGNDYGYLYNWFAVDDRRELAPVGWHVPTDTDWKELEVYLGMSLKEADEKNYIYRGGNLGSKLAGNSELWGKEISLKNSRFGKSGFNALPGGYRNHNYGSYHNMHYDGWFWTASKYDGSMIVRDLRGAWCRVIIATSTSGIVRQVIDIRTGMSIRCLKGSSYKY
jgi:uncharacterized protein (TIGR02145 family)